MSRACYRDRFEVPVYVLYMYRFLPYAWCVATCKV